MLTEEYRPDSMDEVIGQNHIKPKIEEYIRKGEIPNLMFAGDPGLGKTTIAIVIAKQIYGEEWQMHFKELNASDERGIDTVRDRIKEFAKSSYTEQKRTVFLDEADNLTDDAQSALRRTMEKLSTNCRFILSVNYPGKVIPAIQSRCAVYNFEAVPDEEIVEHIGRIAKEKDMDITKGAAEAIARYARGDVRKAVNNMDALYLKGETLTKEEVTAVLPIADKDDVLRLLNLCSVGHFNQALDKADEMMKQKGVTARQIVSEVNEVVWETSMDDESKVRVMNIAGNADYYIHEGAQERIQISALLGRITQECKS